LKDIVEIIDIQLDLAYCIDHITSNTLFESDLLFDGDDEVSLFINIVGCFVYETILSQQRAIASTTLVTNSQSQNTA
jgi:hypothetical protein